MEKIDKIYLDIDGVLKGAASPLSDIITLLRYCLDNYEGSVYWLTTHCRGGENHTKFALKEVFPAEFIDEVCAKIRPTNWRIMKTEAIDMDSDFVWFDDNLFEAERHALEVNYVLDGFFRMDPRDPEMAKKALEFLKKYRGS
ncbi:MAG: hypothetical protein Q4B65_00765 [Candidatus Saccharibacteria bacterium]|nr:hypothetical protein [Candidatus Saccharibacteria bacterium]